MLVNQFNIFPNQLNNQSNTSNNQFPMLNLLTISHYTNQLSNSHNYPTQLDQQFSTNPLMLNHLRSQDSLNKISQLNNHQNRIEFEKKNY